MEQQILPRAKFGVVAESTMHDRFGDLQQLSLLVRTGRGASGAKRRRVLMSEPLVPFDIDIVGAYRDDVDRFLPVPAT